MNKNPYLFTPYQTREEVPANLRVFLITPFDPKLPVKSWHDPVPPPPDDFGEVEYRVLRRNQNGGFDWDEANKRPRFKRMMLAAEFAQLLNIPPKDFTGKTQEIQTLGEIDIPVRVDPPEGYEWQLSMGLIPAFVEKAKIPVTLEDLHKLLLECRDGINRLANGK